MPGILEDLHGKPMPIPVEKSWAEGVPDYSYWNHMYGARKGTIDRAVNTQDSGALNKALLSNLKDLLITEEDCGTSRGIEFAANDRNLIGRTSLTDIPGVVGMGDIISPADVDDIAKKMKGKEIKVRSPLTCASVEGVCATCYGLTPEGHLPKVGTNVGVLDGESITERSTQLTMKTFHSGGSSLAGGGIAAGFPELQRALELPVILPGVATLSTVAGIVNEITPNAAGGYAVVINSVSHNVRPGRTLLVKKGQPIYRGQPLSSGTEKPQEVAELRNFLDAQRGLVNRMSNVYEDKFGKRTFETVIRGISNNALITDTPDDSEFLRGDTVKLSLVEKDNEERLKEGRPLVTFKPYFKSIQVLPHESEDWLSRLTSNNLKRVIQEGAAKGYKTNIHGVDPHPAYLYGKEFADQYDPKRGIFW